MSYWREIAPKKAAAEEAARNFAEEHRPVEYLKNESK
jgi:hypothetical protein